MISNITGRLLLATAAAILGAPVAGSSSAAEAGPGLTVCRDDPSPPEYYAFPLVPTRNVVGAGSSSGRAEVHFGTTPFGVSLAPDGSYRYELRLRIRALPDRGDGAYVAWVTTPRLDDIRRLGAVGPDGRLRGTVTWNKFLVVVTLEPEPAADGGATAPGASDARSGTPWTGPIVMRGMSRSGMMHTMAGHGPFQQENCAAYGYDG